MNDWKGKIKNKKIVLVIIGLALIFLTPLWVFIIRPELEAMSVDYYRYEKQTGFDSLSPFYGSKLPTPFKHNDTQEIRVLEVHGNILKIASRLQATNLETGKKFLDETRIYDVDKVSRTHNDLEQGFFLFPPNTQQRDYFLTFPIGFTHAIYKFEGTDVIHGLEVYVFTCKSDPYDITGAIPLFKDYKVKSMYSCKILVEPVTGQDVDYQLSWESYYEQNGTFTLLAEKGNKETSPEYVTKYIEQAKSEKTVFQIYNQIIPLIMFISGISILIGLQVFRSGKTSKIEDSNVRLVSNIKELEQVAKITTDEIVKSAKLITLGQLSANLTHDIRSGLQTILVAVQFLEKQNKDIPKESKDELIRIKRITEKLSTQISNVMSFVRTTPLQLSEISINKIVDAVLEKINIPSNIKIVKPQNNVKIYCDQDKMESAVTNLIQNAIEVLLGQNGQIVISAKDENDHTLIEIQDSGTGIPVDNMTKVFDPLFTTKLNGIGLGLAICKSVIDEHNGNISVRNNPTTFSITLPKKNR